MSKINRLCTICARGGSKGVENKNLKLISAKPLLEYTVEHAKNSGLFDIVALSSDSDDILLAAERAGADVTIKRPDDLASDTSGKIGAIRHAFEFCENKLDTVYDTYVDLDVTSPLRTTEDIKGAVELLERERCSSVITGCKSRKSPYFNLVELDEESHVRLSKQLENGIVRRQDSPVCYDMNASIYVWQADVFRSSPAVFYPDTQLYEMPEDRSWDIDTPLDFKIVSMLMKQ